MIRMLSLKKATSDYIPESYAETTILREECFNEGWWKGYGVCAIGCLLGIIVGEIISSKL